MAFLYENSLVGRKNQEGVVEMTPIVPAGFFKKDQQAIGIYILSASAQASDAADSLIKTGHWEYLKDLPDNESSLTESLQARKDELAERARGGDRFAAALQEERERTGTERGFEGEPA